MNKLNHRQLVNEKKTLQREIKSLAKAIGPERYRLCLYGDYPYDDEVYDWFTHRFDLWCRLEEIDKLLYTPKPYLQCEIPGFKEKLEKLEQERVLKLAKGERG